MLRRRNRFVAVVAIVSGAALLAACGDDPDAAGDTSGDTVSDTAGDATGEVVVFAAASLTDAFTEIGDAFVAERPDADVTFSFAASSELATQVVEGAPADVYASADLATMDRLTEAGAAAGEPVVFAANSSTIVVEPGNPLGIGSVADLADPDLVLVTCAPEVPCGAYAARIFDEAGVEVTPDSFEENVKAVVTKVALGEADAGIAYETDVAVAADDVDGVVIPPELNVVADYPIVVTAEAPNPGGARAFVDFVTGDTAGDILESFGFTSP
jgi:molybdate transport system substrate-binding protein